MDIKIYGIGGKLEPGASGDCFVGTAHDTTTFLSLVDLVELKGGYMVSLHGRLASLADLKAQNIFKIDFNILHVGGVYSLMDARNLIKTMKRKAG